MAIDLSSNTTGLPPSSCCECGMVMDAAMGARKPKPGDLSLCMYCGCLNAFGEDLALRRPIDEEVLAMAGCAEFQLARRIIEELRQEERKRSGSHD